MHFQLETKNRRDIKYIIRCTRWKSVLNVIEIGHLRRILPPVLPLVGVVGSDRQITNGGIKPHIEHLQKEIKLASNA